MWPNQWHLEDIDIDIDVEDVRTQGRRMASRNPKLMHSEIKTGYRLSQSIASELCCKKKLFCVLSGQIMPYMSAIQSYTCMTSSAQRKINSAEYDVAATERVQIKNENAMAAMRCVR